MVEKKRKYLGVEVDYGRDSLLPEQGMAMLTGKGFYKLDHEVSPQQSFARAATAFCFGDYEFAQRIYDYVSKSWFMYASPVLSNAPEVEWPAFEESEFSKASEWYKNNVDVGNSLPISCYLMAIPDTADGLVEAAKESAWLSMLGGGQGLHPMMRAPDSKSTGVMAHMRGYDAGADSYKQKETRKGSLGAWLPIDHPEILQFMSMREPVGGDQSTKCFNLNNGVAIPDSFMYKVISGEDYELIDPKHGPTGTKLKAKDVWDKLMQLLPDTGEPMIMFTDTVNRNIPKHITRSNYSVRGSNLCSEITLMTDDMRTAVCCLSSVNLDKYNEWKDTSMIEDLVRFLDNVLEAFIQSAPEDVLKRAIYSAKQERAMGIGFMGWQSFLQGKDIAMESGGFNSAIQWIHKIHKPIKERAYAESMRLGALRGEAPDCAGSGMRNSHIFAVAPNASSSSIINVSPSGEARKSNAYVSSGRAGSHLVKNPHLERVLSEVYDMNTTDVWDRVLKDEGSVQGLDFMSDHHKKVFKTAEEIDQMWMVEQYAARTPYICQGQSFNRYINPETITMEEMDDIHITGWLKGIKTFYYCRAKSAKRVDLGTGGKKPLNAIPVKAEFNECLSCEG